MKIKFSILLFSSLLFFAESACAEPLKVSVRAKSAILMNADTGAILFEKNAHKKLHPASITKIITASYGLKRKRETLDQFVTASQESIGSVSSTAKRRSKYTLPAHWIEVGGAHIGLKRGEKLKFETLLYGMMLASGNDAANLIAEHVSGTIPGFSEEITTYAKSLGCENTVFKNPHGLHHPEHITTAYDMALIAKDALQDPLFRKIVSTVRYTRPKTDRQSATTWVQTNRLLKTSPFTYDKAIGVKTGYHSNAGYTLVAAAEDNGRRLIAVLLGCKDSNHRYQDAIALFDKAFAEETQERVLLSSGLQPYSYEIADSSLSVPTKIDQGVKVRFYPSEEPNLKAWLDWDTVELPIYEGDQVGLIHVSNQEGDELASVPLIAAKDVSNSWLPFSPTLTFFGIVCGILFSVWFFAFRRR